MKYLQLFLSCGIPLDKTSGILRSLLESISYRSLDSIQNMKPMLLKDPMKIEKNLQVKKLCGKKISIIADAISRMGGVFALVARFFSV
jgi:hypothetical protein